MKKHLSILSLTRYIALIAAVLFGSLPLPASAMDIPFFQGNEILYYDGSSGEACSTVGASYSTNLDLPVLSGSDNSEKIWNFLKAEGLSDEAAAGIMGNLKQESNYEPDALEGNGVGYGIIQWSFERRDALEAAAKEKGVPVSDLGFQLAYMKQEAESTSLINFNNLYSSFSVSSSDNAWDPLKEITTVDRATTFWHDAFERSGDYDNHGSIQHRIDFASEAFKQFTGRSASGSTSGGAACSAVGSGDLQATVLEYAWPDYHDAPYLEMMPAYKEAVDQATGMSGDGTGGSNIGVGGNDHPGIDCAGFVNLLVINSGFDPEFNNKGVYTEMEGMVATGDGGSRMSATDYQRRWMELNWQSLGAGDTLSTADLQPGDVGVTYPNNGSTITSHVFIYVGDISGFNGQFASASVGGTQFGRAPMAAGTYENVGSSAYTWFRKK